MLFREAQVADIPQLSVVRLSVLENRLSNPALVTTQDYVDYLTQRGKGWACEENGGIVGFGIADRLGHSIWALFVQPEFAGLGIGKQLHELMLNWYFAQTSGTVWLSTARGTRAEEFYRRQGWQDTGLTKSGEVRFEMTVGEWNQKA
ncbi:GNAT family N-acetyltransferase [Hymenobacter taeanensis]|uniref:GNAT family N-acetyltransferase n=1 Tax=Hymenobacter taeanensis TaxID=2735321 RepID=A0A6M6BHR8_9BACT|nr:MULTISPECIES: GNAT family N-acetyltransferase [Hymenobacter]QJX47589.1 GNAT family N-acetyltransferase [Hymenobacter taeanensis]UOQ82927.1 GNAT family N-acetyltransferase [Hymenobacter sp. 5414T-23]